MWSTAAPLMQGNASDITTPSDCGTSSALPDCKARLKADPQNSRIQSRQTGL